MKMDNLILMLFLFSSLVFQAQEKDANGEIIVEDNQVAEGQTRDSKAMDATATQWSFQLAYQWMPDYHDDMVNGNTRPAGLDNYLQLRIVAPVPMKSVTILPRLTVRHYEDVNTGKSGFGNTELFALIIPKATDWGSGRAGIGPIDYCSRK